MPCNCDHMNPNEREVALRQAANLLRFTQLKLGMTVPRWVVKESKNIYANDERSVTRLCEILRAMTEEQMDAIVYNGRNKTSRELADWWEEHQEVDRKKAAVKP